MCLTLHVAHSQMLEHREESHRSNERRRKVQACSQLLSWLHMLTMRFRKSQFLQSVLTNLLHMNVRENDGKFYNCSHSPTLLWSIKHKREWKHLHLNKRWDGTMCIENIPSVKCNEEEMFESYLSLQHLVQAEVKTNSWDDTMIMYICFAYLHLELAHSLAIHIHTITYA